MWVDMFKYEYCVIDDTLFIKGHSELDPAITAFSMPIGPMPLERAVRLIIDYCNVECIPVVFSAVPEDRIEYLLSLCPADVKLTEMEAWSDYLYNIEDIATLTGKRYAKKRNHVNRFELENPDYTVEPLNYRVLPEVLMFNAGRDDDSSDMERYEHSQCVDVLNHYSSYPFEGLVLRDSTGEICAFTCGEIIGDTLYVHIEKMNHDIAGSGEMIAHLYAADMMRRHHALRYINREEDCGDEGLRRSKLSWNPVEQLTKYEVAITN